mmetsp:Transcript_42076/g.116262  ORF Transcript_42076/g.116262 Transcript_42076/m.116262 type:complete len:180 (+) Transcript_42076:366-905(+)
MTRPTKSVRRRRAGAAVQVILVRFVLALALKYLLTPLIDLLSYSVPLLPSECCGGCRLKLPRALAILVALALAVSCLGVLGVVVGRSIGEFATHADSYRARLEELLGRALNATSSLHSLALGDDGGWAAHGQKGTLLKVDGARKAAPQKEPPAGWRPPRGPPRLQRAGGGVGLLRLCRL